MPVASQTTMPPSRLPCYERATCPVLHASACAHSQAHAHQSPSRWRNRALGRFESKQLRSTSRLLLSASASENTPVAVTGDSQIDVRSPQDPAGCETLPLRSLHRLDLDQKHCSCAQVSKVVVRNLRLCMQNMPLDHLHAAVHSAVILHGTLA